MSIYKQIILKLNCINEKLANSENQRFTNNLYLNVDQWRF